MEYILYNVAVVDSDVYNDSRSRNFESSAKYACVSSRLDLA